MLVHENLTCVHSLPGLPPLQSLGASEVSPSQVHIYCCDGYLCFAVCLFFCIHLVVSVICSCFCFLLEFTLQGWSCPSTSEHSHDWMWTVSDNKRTKNTSLAIYMCISHYIATHFPLEPQLLNLILNGHFHPVWEAYTCNACGSWFSHFRRRDIWVVWFVLCFCLCCGIWNFFLIIIIAYMLLLKVCVLALAHLTEILPLNVTQTFFQLSSNVKLIYFMRHKLSFIFFKAGHIFILLLFLYIF